MPGRVANTRGLATRGVATFLGPTILLVASSAHAAAPGAGATFEDNPINYEPPKTVRRGGFAMAVQVGYGIGAYRGYPNEIAALGEPSERSSTGPALSSHLGVWLGGALRDWLTTGLGVSMNSAMGENRGVYSGFIVHVEAFPLFSLGGLYRDLGVGLEGGIATALLADNDDQSFDDPLAEGGGMSSLSVSFFWEPLKFWNFSAGPSLTYSRAFSQSMTVDQATLGFRLALYGVQPKKKKSGGS